jgi:hypothetical protein
MPEDHDRQPLVVMLNNAPAFVAIAKFDHVAPPSHAQTMARDLVCIRAGYAKGKPFSSEMSTLRAAL